MKRFIAVLIPVLIIAGGAYATGGTPTPTPDPTYVNTQVGIENNIDTTQYQNVSLDGGGDSSSTAYGGDSKSDAASSSGASINTSSVSNYKTRTPPLSVQWT